MSSSHFSVTGFNGPSSWGRKTSFKEQSHNFTKSKGEMSYWPIRFSYNCEPTGIEKGLIYCLWWWILIIEEIGLM